MESSLSMNRNCNNALPLSGWKLLKFNEEESVSVCDVSSSILFLIKFFTKNLFLTGRVQKPFSILSRCNLKNAVIFIVWLKKLSFYRKKCSIRLKTSPQTNQWIKHGDFSWRGNEYFHNFAILIIRMLSVWYGLENVWFLLF